jgi:hypothetical protein
MKLTSKLFLIVLGGIFVALAIMLAIALVLGNRTSTDPNNSDVDSNSAGPVGLELVR